MNHQEIKVHYNGPNTGAVKALVPWLRMTKSTLELQMLWCHGSESLSQPCSFRCSGAFGTRASAAAGLATRASDPPGWTQTIPNHNSTFFFSLRPMSRLNNSNHLMLREATIAIIALLTEAYLNPNKTQNIDYLLLSIFFLKFHLRSSCNRCRGGHQGWRNLRASKDLKLRTCWTLWGAGQGTVACLVAMMLKCLGDECV